jgi:hypothetical protein
MNNPWIFSFKHHNWNSRLILIYLSLLVFLYFFPIPANQHLFHKTCVLYNYSFLTCIPLFLCYFLVLWFHTHADKETHKIWKPRIWYRTCFIAQMKFLKGLYVCTLFIETMRKFTRLYLMRIFFGFAWKMLHRKISYGSLSYNRKYSKKCILRK